MKINTLEERQTAIGNKKLAFIGDANWDTFVDDNDRLWSIPKPDCLGCHMTPFGDRNHVKRLMSNGYHNDTPTDAGLALMSGLRSQLMMDCKGRSWHMLSFN